MAAVGQAAAGELEAGIGAQMIKIIGVLVAASDGEHAGAQNIGDAVRHEQWIARISNQTCQPISDPQTALGSGQQHDAAVRGEASAVKVSGDCLAAHGWKQERRGRIVGHGGCGSACSGEGMASTPNP